jgi:hypothetical protein
MNNRRAVQTRTALLMSRLSPASSYQLAAMSTAGTDPEVKSRYESELDSYRERFSAFVDEQQAGSGAGERIMIRAGSGGTFNLTQSAEQAQLDPSLLPVFTYQGVDVKQVINTILPDVLLMIIVSALSFFGAFVAFTRYDVR